MQVLGKFVEQAVDPLLEREGLVALAHFQQAHGLATQCRAVLLQAFEQPFEKAAGVGIALAQAKPEAAPMLRQGFAKFDGQRAFAKACRCVDQQQPAIEAGVQTLTQPRTRHMAVRQRRPEERPSSRPRAWLANPCVRDRSVMAGSF